MATPEIVDISGLTAPIPGDNPAGTDIRDNDSPTSPYQNIKDARNAARAAERSSMFDGGSPEADQNWRQILQLAPELIKDQSKDLEVACWYIEALIRRYGFQGLRDGFILVRQLIELYWDNLYPMPDEDGIETRVAPLTGLNGEGAEGVLIAPIRNVHITEASAVGPFNFWQYQQALDTQKIMDEEQRASKISTMGFGLEDIERAVAASSDAFYTDLRDDLAQAIDEYRKISRLLDERCGTHEAPPSSNIINALENSLGAVKHLAKDKLASSETTNDAMDTRGEDVTSAPGGTKTVKISGPVQSREEAFKQLREISEFFRKTEPHSPISYVLGKAVKWGEMSLSELIVELIPDSGARDFYSTLTGVKPKEE